MSTMIRIEVGVFRRSLSTIWHIFFMLRCKPRPANWREFFEMCQLNWQLNQFYYPRPSLRHLPTPAGSAVGR